MLTCKLGCRGFTLIEVMIAMVIAMLVIAAAFTVLVTSNKGTVVNEIVAETQQNVRLAMDLISRDIKMAGFNMSGTIGNCTVGIPPQPVPIVPLDNTPVGAVGAINDVGSDSVRLVVPSLTASSTGGIPTLTAPALSNASTITLAAADVTAMVAAGLAAGSVVSIGGSHTTVVTAIAGGVLTLASPVPPMPPPATTAVFPAGTRVYLLQCVTYAISTNQAICGGSDTCLTRNGVAVVDGIEDLQLAYGCDGCNILAPNPPNPNGVIDDQDASGGTFTQADLVTNSGWNLAPMTPDKIKLVQVTIVARQPKGDQGLSEISNQNTKGTYTAGPIIASDHNPSADVGYNAITYSQQRRRVLTKTIQVRNMES